MEEPDSPFASETNECTYRQQREKKSLELVLKIKTRDLKEKWSSHRASKVDDVIELRSAREGHFPSCQKLEARCSIEWGGNHKHQVATF